MKTTLLCITLCLALFGTCQAADYFLPPEATSPRFRLEPTLLVLWGSGLSSTGHSQLKVKEEDVPYDTIKTWYATILVCKIMGWDTRITYDDSTGRIIRIIPNN